MNELLIIGTWREDASIIGTAKYKRKFAIFPVTVTGGKIWMKFYYKKYMVWHHGYSSEYTDGSHTELVEKISEDEYIVRKLAETL